jgi:hypothetical protein
MIFKLSLRLNRLTRAARPFAAVILMLLCTACAFREQLPYHRAKAPLPSGPVCRIAVLPFLNDSGFPQADAIVKKILMAQLQEAGDFQVLQDGDILKVYQQMNIYPGTAPVLEQMQLVADRINAQLLISGIVMVMREDPGEYATVNPKIIMALDIRDGHSGEILWTSYHNRKGSDYKKTMHFGTIYSIAGLSRQMVSEIINLWFEKGLPQCNVFSRP